MRWIRDCGLVLAALLAWSGTSAAAEWRPIVSPFGQVFPSLLIATASMPAPPAHAKSRVLGDGNGVIGASVLASRDGERARLTVRMPTLARESTLEVVLPKAGVRYALYPTMQWDFARLARVRQPGPDSIELELALDDAKPERRTERVRVRSINDAPYYVLDGARSADLNWMFAAYVNEEHPLVEQILKEALRSGTTKRFDGYQKRDPEQVYRQVFAVWNVLQRRGIRYSSITRTSSASDKVLSQHVRFLEQSWENSQANCVDGSVLLASILRRIDLNPSLVLTPGHMFLAFDLDARGRERAYLETTLLGTVERHGNGRLKGLSDSLEGDVDEDESFATFERAVEQGFARYQRARAKFADETAHEYQIIDIEAARRRGVTPIAFQR